MKKFDSPKRSVIVLGTVAMVFMMSAAVFAAFGISGAIYTTRQDGSTVNENIYQSKTDVYLNGGPNNGNNRGLPEGDYYFQVTDPSGKTLLSTDSANCRVLHVNAAGRVDGPIGACQHASGVDATSGFKTVQLYPFANTPNNGGEYKVWLIPVGSADVDEDGVSLSFKNSAAKTDNFKAPNEEDCNCG